MHSAFVGGTAGGLLHLATTDLQSNLPPAFGFARDFARLYLTRLCQTPADGESGSVPPIPQPSETDLAFQVLQAPPMQGCEYLTADVLATWWTDLDTLVRDRDRAPRGRGPGLPQRAKPAVAARRPRDVPPRREQARPGAPVRVSGDLSFPAVGPGTSAARAAGQGPAAIRRSEEPAGTPFALGADPARGRAQPADQGDWSSRARSIIPWPGHRARRTGSFRTSRSSRRAAWSSGCRTGGSRVIRLGPWSTSRSTPARRVRLSVGRPARFLRGRDARWRAAHRGRARAAARVGRRTGGHSKGNGSRSTARSWPRPEHWKKVERDTRENGLSFYEGMRLLSGVPQETRRSVISRVKITSGSD